MPRYALHFQHSDADFEFRHGPSPRGYICMLYANDGNKTYFRSHEMDYTPDVPELELIKIDMVHKMRIVIGKLKPKFAISLSL